MAQRFALSSPVRYDGRELLLCSSDPKVETWERRTGVAGRTLLTRLIRGWTLADTFRTKVKRRPTSKGERLVPEPLTLTEVEKLLRECSSRAPTGLRNRALIVLLWRGQLRVSEALGLMPRDLDADAGTIRVRHGKGDKWRIIGIDKVSLSVVVRWLDARKALGFTGRQPILCTLDGEPMEAAYVRALLPRLAAKAGIEKRVHAHGLRHTGAFELANEGHPIHVIQQQLGHSSLATTDRYIRHLNPRQVVETMQRRTWRGIK